MENGFGISIQNMQKLQTANELREVNDITLRYGLFLSEVQIARLIEKRFEALKDTDRIEFGQGIIKKIIYEFCDSPYISQENYEEIIFELVDSFYYYKNESLDILSDEELIKYMKIYFDDYCEGSIDYLNGTYLEHLCKMTIGTTD